MHCVLFCLLNLETYTAESLIYKQYTHLLSAHHGYLRTLAASTLVVCAYVLHCVACFTAGMLFCLTLSLSQG